METREQQMKELQSFIENCEKRVDRILGELGWSKEDTIKDFNKSPTVKKEYAIKDDPEYPPSFPWQHSVTIDSQTMNDILSSVNGEGTKKTVPNKFSDLQVNFSREEKLALYEHCINKAGRFSEPEMIITVSQEEDTKKKMTFAELVALKRDLKRRRLKYRTTKTAPLSYTEEIRNLIQLQMEAVSQYLQPEKTKDISNPSTSQKKPSGRSRNAEMESKDRKSRNKKKRSRSRDHKRDHIKHAKSYYQPSSSYDKKSNEYKKVKKRKRSTRSRSST